MLRCQICQSEHYTKQAIHRCNTLPTENLPARMTAEWCRCAQCGFCWITPAPPLDELLSAYRDTPADHWGAAGVSSENAVPRQYAEKVANLMPLVATQTHGEPIRILDIGCFHGDFLMAFPEHCEKHGIELSAGAAQVARDRGIVIYEGDIMSVDPPDGYFDLIVCCDVIEHIEDQSAFAARIKRWLKPKGVAVLETGAADAPMARVMGPRWYYLSIVEHVVAHSRESLDRLMASERLFPIMRERRWHRLPPGWRQPLFRVSRALVFRMGTLALERLDTVVPLPPQAKQVVERHSPWHATRDHLFHAYRRDS